MAGLIAHERALVELTQRLVRFPSPQTDQMEAEPQVLAFIGECVEPILRGWGMATRRDAMGNLIAELGPERSQRGVLVMTYAMTHPASSMSAPFAGELCDTADGPAVRGRGVSEQKGALAAALAAIEPFARRSDLGGRLVFALSTAGETGRHDAARAIAASLGRLPPLGIVAVGTNGRIALGNKGRIDVEIDVHGKAAHSSTPWAGINAIEGARLLLDRVARVDLSGRKHPALGAASLTQTSIESWPKATHTIQNRVRLVLDRRLLPGDDPDAAFAQLEDLLARDPGPFRIEVRRGPFMFPAEISADGTFLTHVRGGCAAEGMPVPDTFYSHAALDAGYLASAGCEATMWGPGRMEQFHSDEEALLVCELMAGARAYRGFLASCLGQIAPPGAD